MTALESYSLIAVRTDTYLSGICLCHSDPISARSLLLFAWSHMRGLVSRYRNANSLLVDLNTYVVPEAACCALPLFSTSATADFPPLRITRLGQLNLAKMPIRDLSSRTLHCTTSLCTCMVLYQMCSRIATIFPVPVTQSVLK